MSLGFLDFDQIEEANLRSLIDTGVPEGISIDYKRDGYGRRDADKKEFLKDVSAFANASGGHLIIGIAEKEGVPTEITPLKEVDPDEEILRFESLMRGGLEPRITGARIRAIRIADEGYAIVIRVPRSWNPPHRVSTGNSNRFYIRNSGGAHEVSVEELRVLFNISASAHDRVRAFRQERIAKISAGETPIPMAHGRGKLILHIVPLSAFSEPDQVDLRRAYEAHQRLRPIGSLGMSPRFNFDGFINIRGGGQCHGYTQLFRNGCIEAIKVGIIRGKDNFLVIPSNGVGKQVTEVIPVYLDALRILDIPPPFIVMLTLEEVNGTILGVKDHDFDFHPSSPITQSILKLPEIIIDNYGDAVDYLRALRPAFDALWNAGGYVACPYFDANGDWTGIPPT